MTRQPNTRPQIIAAGIARALDDAEDCIPGSAARVGQWLDLRARGVRCIAVGRVIHGGPVQIDAALTPDDEFQFCIVDNEKLCKSGLDADPEYLPLSDEPGYSESLQPYLW